MNAKKNKCILWALTLLFITPGLAAYLFYMNPQWLKNKTTNRGHFVSPREPLPLFHDQHWHLLLWCKKGAIPACLERLDQLAHVRLALGRRFYQVELWMIQPDHTPIPTLQNRKKFNHYHIHWQVLSPDHKALPTMLKKSSATYIVNPADVLILEYHDKDKPEAIFHDIKHLLTSSEANN